MLSILRGQPANGQSYESQQIGLHGHPQAQPRRGGAAAARAAAAAASKHLDQPYQTTTAFKTPIAFKPQAWAPTVRPAPWEKGALARPARWARCAGGAAAMWAPTYISMDRGAEF